MRQDAFFETVDLPMADLWEAAQNAPKARLSVPGTTTSIADEDASAGYVRGQWPAESPTQPKDKWCLHCGKASVGMFCNATCKAKWQAGMNRWHNSLPKTPASETVEMF